MLMTALFAMVLSAPPQQRSLEDVHRDYEASVHCAAVMELAAGHRDGEALGEDVLVRRYRAAQEKLRGLAHRFGPQLRLSDDVIKTDITDARRTLNEPIVQALRAQDMAGYTRATGELDRQADHCESELTRLDRI